MAVGHRTAAQSLEIMATDVGLVLMTNDDGTLPGVSDADKADYMAYRRCFELHSYYPALRDHTFATTFIDVTREAAAAWRKANAGKALSADDQAAYDAMRNAVDAAIRAMAGDAFVRLSTRSPKDAVPHTPRIDAILREELQRAGGADAANTARLAAVRRAMTRCLAVADGAAAFELMGYSGRIVSDLIRCIEYVPADRWDLKVVVRRFDARVTPRSEFRGFVHEGRLTALSQYFSDAFFPGLAERAHAVLAPAMVAYFNEVKGAIEEGTGQRSYIVDFSVLDDGRDYPVVDADDADGGGGGDDDDGNDSDDGGDDGVTRPNLFVIRKRYSNNQAYCDACAQGSATIQGRRAFATGMNGRPCPRCGHDYNGAMGKICQGCAHQSAECPRCLVKLLTPVVGAAEEPERPRIVCVEINPWGNTTGACLFSWERDRAVLESTTGFEFRCKAIANEAEAGAHLSAYSALLSRVEGGAQQDGGGGGGGGEEEQSARRCSLS